MESIRTLLERRFVLDLLNGLSIPLEVQCAALDAHGKSYLRAEASAPPDALPYDISRYLAEVDSLDRPSRKEWKDALAHVLGQARTSLRAQSARYKSRDLEWAQCVAPVSIGKECVGFILSGKIPLGPEKALRDLARSIEQSSDAPAHARVATALRSIGLLPEARIQNRLAMVAESASAASGIAERRQKSLRDEATQARLQVQQALDEVIQAMSRGQDSDSILRVIVNHGFRLVGAKRGTISIWDPEKERLFFRATVPPDPHSEIRGDGYGPDEGIVGWAFRHGESVLVHDLETEKKWQKLYMRIFPGIRAELAVPLVATNGDVLGVLNVESECPGAFTKDHTQILRILANHAAVALDKAELMQSKARLAETKARQLEAFTKATSKLRAPVNLEKALKTIVHQATIAVSGSIGGLKLYDDRDGYLKFRTIVAVDGTEYPPWDEPFPVWVKAGSPEDSLSARVLRDREAIVTANADEEGLWREPPWEAKSGIHVPLFSHEQVIGVLAVDSPRPDRFKREDVKILEVLASQIVTAVESDWHDDLMRRIAQLLEHALAISMDQEPRARREAILAGLARTIYDVMKPRACSVIVPTEFVARPEWMEIPADCEYGIERPRPLRLPYGQGLCGRAIQKRSIQYSPDVREHSVYADKRLAKRQDLVSALSVPIRTNGKALGALNYYSRRRRRFTKFEEDALTAVCGIAGMVVSVTHEETQRRKRILDALGTGVTLVSIPRDWDIHRQMYDERDPDWNVDLDLQLLFINEIHRCVYAPGVRVGDSCYRAFNQNPEQHRPCWWCPTVRAMITGKPHTAYTHSPLPPKKRIEHFKVTASILEESGKPFAAIESTVPATREVEAHYFSTRLFEAVEEGAAIDLAAECLGRGTRSDCALFVRLLDGGREVQVDRVYKVNNRVVAQECRVSPEWKCETALELPPLEDYFRERDEKNLRIFQRRHRSGLVGRKLSAKAARLMGRVAQSESGFRAISGKSLERLLDETGLLGRERAVDKSRTPPRGLIVRLGRSPEPWACWILLDNKPGTITIDEPESERHWCTEICSELATKVEGIRLRRNLEELVAFRKNVIERAPVGVITTDAQGKVTSVNSEWKKTSRCDITGSNLTKNAGLEAAGLLGEVRNALRGRPIDIVRRKIHVAPDRDIIVSARSAPMRDAKGRQTGCLISVWDMTALARQQQEVLRHRDLTSLAGFVAGTVHEMRTPVRAVQYAVKRLTKELSDLVSAERSLQAVPFTARELGKIRAIVDRVAGRMSSGAARSEHASRVDVATVKKLLSRHHLDLADFQLEQLARFVPARRLSALLSFKDGIYAENLLDYFLALSSVAGACANASDGIDSVNAVVSAIAVQRFVVTGEFRKADIHHTLDAALVVLARELDDNEVLVDRRYSLSLPKIACVPGGLAQLWRNLLINAIEATSGCRRRGRLTVSTRRAGRNVCVRIRDNGEGIPKEVDTMSLGTSLPDVASGETRSFGLWIARRIVDMHQGKIAFRRLKSPPGTAIIISLPIERQGLSEGKG